MISKCLARSYFTLLAGLLLSTAHAQFDDLIINGGFEDSVTGPNKQINPNADTTSYTQLDSWATSTDTNKLTFLFSPTAGDTTGSRGRYYATTPFTLWGLNNGGAGPTALGPSPLGGNYLASDGDPTHNVPITQIVAGLTPGQDYNVSFYWAAAQQRTFDGATTERWQVTLGTQTKTTPTFSLANHAFSGWMQQTLTFTATTTSAALAFLAIGTPNGLPPFLLLDGVSMVAVPEPSTYLLVISALAVCVVLRRKVRKTSES